MYRSIATRIRNKTLSGVVFLALLFTVFHAGTTYAINPLPIPPPEGSAYGLVATKKQAPPASAPTISTPGNGANFSTSPITVSGVCQTGLLVQVYNNGVFVGSAECRNGSYSLQVSLFSGQNDITAIQYDELDQGSPVSNTVTVMFNNATAGTAFASPMTLTSNYGRRAANPNAELTWPLVLSGGLGPYAFSIDWGDGTEPELKSQALAGVVDIKHSYKQAGLYRVTVKVTDSNGQTAFLQLIAVANGQPTAPAAATDNKQEGGQAPAQVLWIPTVISLVLLIPTYWLGRRSMMVSLRRKLEKDMQAFKEL